MTSTPVILRAIRAKLKLTQDQLAERLRVSFATVNRWEGAVNEPRRAARDAIGSEFGSRHTQYEMFYAGARYVSCGHSYRTYDWAGAAVLVDRLLAVSEIPTA